MKKSYFSFLLLLLSFMVKIEATTFEWQSMYEDPESNTLTVSCSFDFSHYVVADSLKAIFLPEEEPVANIVFTHSPQELYTPIHKQPLLVLYGKGTITFVGMDLQEAVEAISISFKEYDMIQKKEISHTLVIRSPLNKDVLSVDHDILHETEIDFLGRPPEEKSSFLEEEQEGQGVNEQSIKESEKSSFADFILEKLKSSEKSAFWAVFLLIFFLGVIMSLTPCVYPMIPLVLSIIGGQGDSKKTFVRACVYVTGMATTFAILGLAASSGVLVFGSLLSKKWFLILVLIVLTYVTGAMMGFYDMSSFFSFSFQNSYEKKTFGALFLYGMLSGTISSPCVSPGLIALLSLVATLNSFVYSFLYLFIFGIGLGVPLIVAATLADRLEALPSSGIWMIEFKRLIGFLMIAVWYGYAILVLPIFYVYFIIFVVCLMILYELINLILLSKNLFIYRIILIFTLSIGSLYIGYKGLMNNSKPKKHFYYEDVRDAFSHALQSKKYLLLDFGADWCSACRDFEKRCMDQVSFWEQLDKVCVGLHVDCTNTSVEEIKNLLSEYEIRGFPTVVIVDPAEKIVIAKIEGSLLQKESSVVADYIISTIGNFEKKS